jgi:hypothetical protein
VVSAVQVLPKHDDFIIAALEYGEATSMQKVVEIDARDINVIDGKAVHIFSSPLALIVFSSTSLILY